MFFLYFYNLAAVLLVKENIIFCIIDIEQRCPTHSPLATCGEWAFKCGEWLFFSIQHKIRLFWTKQDKNYGTYFHLICTVNMKIMWKELAQDVKFVKKAWTY